MTGSQIRTSALAKRNQSDQVSLLLRLSFRLFFSLDILLKKCNFSSERLHILYLLYAISEVHPFFALSLLLVLDFIVVAV